MEYIPYAVATITGICVWSNLYRKQRAHQLAMEAKRATRGIVYNQNPVIHAEDGAMWEAQVRDKSAKLLRKERGPSGGILYVYYLQGTDQIMYSDVPIDLHTNT